MAYTDKTISPSNINYDIQSGNVCGYSSYEKCLRLFETIKIFLNSFELRDFSME